MSTTQLITFQVGKDTYGIEVNHVQEVTRTPNVVSVPLAPAFVLGLVNLRGQVAMALGLRELFQLPKNSDLEQMSVICKIEGGLVSLLVDSIGDVVEVDITQYERTPENVPVGVRRFLSGVYKMQDSLLSVVDLQKFSSELSNLENPRRVA